MDEQKKKAINCRICLRVNVLAPEKCLSLFEKHNASIVADQIKYIADISITRDDGLPDKICLDCLLQLDNAVHFKQQCENSDKILNAVVQVEPLNVCEVGLDAPVIKEENDTDVMLTDAETNYRDSEYSYYEPEQPKKKSKVKTKSNKDSKSTDLKLICDDCGEKFKSKCKLAVHWKKAHLLSKLICPRCKRMFKSYKAYHMHAKKPTRSCQVSTQVHIEGQGKTRVYHCKECNYSTKRIKDMDAHMATHTGDRRFQCADCNKCFTQHSSLQGHREAYHQDYKKQSTCHICGKFFKGRMILYKHLRIHQPKQVKCDQCEKMFKSRSILIAHMKRHLLIKSFYCNCCSAKFYTAGELSNHKNRVHTKAKIYNCDLCEYKSYAKALTKAHRAKHTPTNTVCLECNMFVEKDMIDKHKKRHEKNYLCPHCAQTFHLEDSVKRHIRKKHKDSQSITMEKVKTIITNPPDNSFLKKFEESYSITITHTHVT